MIISSIVDRLIRGGFVKSYNMKPTPNAETDTKIRRDLRVLFANYGLIVEKIEEKRKRKGLTEWKIITKEKKKRGITLCVSPD